MTFIIRGIVVFQLLILTLAQGALADQFGEQFPQAAADALIRRLEVETTPEGLPPGVDLQRQMRWDPALNALLVDSVVSNRGTQAAKLDEMALLSLSFRMRSLGEDAPYEKLAYRNDTWYGSTFWSGPDWTRVGKDWHHPGEKTPSVRCFRVPRDGHVTLSGRVYKLHRMGDGVRLSILHGKKEVWNAQIDGADGQGVEPKLTLDVRKGDALRFMVHKRGSIACDTTHWDPVVTYADGKRFQASQAFGNRQGVDQWFYEMQTGRPTAASIPTLYGLGSDLSLRSWLAEPQKSLTLSAGDALPWMVLADGLDASGVAMAIDSGEAWSCRAAATTDGLLRITLSARGEKGTPLLAPGEKRALPSLAISAFQGPWTGSLAFLKSLVDSRANPARFSAAATRIDAAYRGIVKTLKRPPDLDLLLMAQAEWRRDDKIDETAAAFAKATDEHLRRARALAVDLRRGQSDALLAEEMSRLDSLSPLAARGTATLDQRRSLYLQVRLLKRQIALANPLLSFEKLLFCKRVPTSYSHLVMQYFGWRARGGGGLFVLERPGCSLDARDLLDGRLSDGNVLEPRLSYDAQRIVFSYVTCRDKAYNPNELDHGADDGFYHVFEVKCDGTGLRQLSSGPYDDLMPTYLPDGGIAFCSTRRRGHARCFGGQFSPRWHVYTLHRMDADGGNMRILSVHDTNEWFPAVSNAGLILYGRWDYIDRDAVTHQNLWSTRPNGTNPTAVWGNATPSPHCTFQAQPIPGSNKIIFTASAHHSITAGSVAILDPSVGNNGQEAITRITPAIPFPEAESRDIREYYASPWPLSEKYFLVSYSPTPLVWEPGANRRNALGIYLLDAAGNRELIYRDLDIGCETPIPWVPRPAPPIFPSTLPDEEPATGEMVVVDVTQGLGRVPRGTIKELRIVQIFPKTTNVANHPPIGLAGEENARAILGTVPVESDGSARFVVPARTPILFQALDADGMAYQTMRSLTYVQPGEQLACIGCHENGMTAPVAHRAMALDRPPSRIQPGQLGGRPFSFVEVVQPVLDRHCVSCHGEKKLEGKLDLRGMPQQGFTRSYWSLCGNRDVPGADAKTRSAGPLVPRFPARNQIQVTPPGGAIGARGSRLMHILRKDHYGVKLADDDLRRVAAWIDMNAVFYGVYSAEQQAVQLHGDPLAMPEIQ